MAWDDFKNTTLPWEVIRSVHDEVKAPHVLEFVGGGSKVDSKMKTLSGDWEEAEYLGGSGTDPNPDVVRLFRKGKEYFIQRSGRKLACHSGKATLTKPYTHRGNQGGDEGEGTNPVWEAQEGGRA